MAVYARKQLDVAKYWKMRIGTSVWRPNPRRRTQLLDRQAGGIIMDMIQGILSLPESSIQRRMDIEIDIFIVHWVLTLNSHYGTKLGLNDFFAVQPSGEIRPKCLSIAVFAETELARHGGSNHSLSGGWRGGTRAGCCVCERPKK